MNRLQDSASPYLLQHAHQPVHWQPWDAAALHAAKTRNMPIFLSIGYAACHWCHVMAHESFDDPAIAAYMNEHFISIKVDREERPDLDAIYMQATVAMTGSGGWPMSVFLSPDLAPFYAGTYFPPAPRHGLPAFLDVLKGISRAWSEQRVELEALGKQIEEHLKMALSMSAAGPESFDRQRIQKAGAMLAADVDWIHGGWGSAPKFPQAMAVEFLLQLSEGKEIPAASSLDIPDARTENVAFAAPGAAVHSLRCMAQGGMCDLVGGGFSRYSTDDLWLVPHFEKMLYDNALLARAYLHGWQLTHDPDLRNTAVNTLHFALEELAQSDGGFSSSIDADSEGGEGAYYCWASSEIARLLGDQAELFSAAYSVTRDGNWEGKTILRKRQNIADLAARFHLPQSEIEAILSSCSQKLRIARALRSRPATDDKVILSWNGLMLEALAEAACALAPPAMPGQGSQDSPFLAAAQKNAQFLLTALRPAGKLRHCWRRGAATEAVFLEDYAALILGLVALYQADFNPVWYREAQLLCDQMISLFQDPSGGFFDTTADAEFLLLRPKDQSDNATPAGNSLACEALLKLAVLSGNGQYRHLAEQSLARISSTALAHPLFHGRWLSAAHLAQSDILQVAILTGGSNDHALQLLQAARQRYLPNLIIAASAYPPPKEAPALLQGRPLHQGLATAYVCRGEHCSLPITVPAELAAALSPS